MLIKAFKGADNYYGECTNLIPIEGEKDKKITVIKSGLPPLVDHFSSAKKIGLFPFVDNFNVGFGAIDIDDYDVDIVALQKKCLALGFNPLIVSSTNGGCHLFTLFDQPTRAELVLDRLNGIATQIGYEGCEVFPKQTKCDPKYDASKNSWSGIGNFIYLPYGRFGNSYAIDDEGNKLSIKEFGTFVETKYISIASIPIFKKSKPKTKTTLEQRNSTTLAHLALVTTSQGPGGGEREAGFDNEDIMVDAPPCMQQIYMTGLKQGERDNGLYNFAVLLRKAKGTVTAEMLEPYNNKCNPPFDADADGNFSDLIRIANSVNNDDHFYKCNDVPIKSLCSKPVCKTRKFGLKGLAVVDTKKYPFTYCRQQNGFADNRNGEIYPAGHTGNLLKSEIILNNEDKRITETGHYLLNPNTEKVDHYGFNPTKPNRYFENRQSYFNAYRPPLIVPEDGDIEPWLKLIKTVVPDEELIHPFHQYLAHNIQKPGVKIKWAPLIISPQGLGKDLIAEGVSPSMGSNYVKHLDMKTIKQLHTGHLEKKLFLILSETKETGRDRSVVMETLKTMVSDKKLSIRKMGMDAYDIDNVTNGFFISNHRKCLTLEDDARRFMVMINDSHRRDRDFYAPIWDLVEQHPGIIYKFYREYDLTGFDIATAPQTKYLKEVARETDAPPSQVLDMFYNEKIKPFHPDSPYVVIPHLAEGFRAKKRYKIDEIVITNWLQHRKQRGAAVDLKQIRWHDGEKPMVWSLEPDTHTEKVPTQLRELYFQPVVEDDRVVFRSWYGQPY